MAEVKKKKSTTTVTAPNTAKAATDRVNQRTKAVTPERLEAARKTIEAKKKPASAPKVKKKTIAGAAPKKKTTTTTGEQVMAAVKNKEKNSITPTSLGVSGIEENARLAQQYQESTDFVNGVPNEQVQAPDPYAYAREGLAPQSGGAEQIAPLPPAQELPPDAPLWLKLIRGVLTPVPPLAMIPHMFIQGMEQKRAAAQAADAENMKYFWDLYDSNPIAAADLAKTPLFRDTLQRRHGFTAQDLQDIQESAKAQPFKGSELAQMISSGVAEKAPTERGVTQGDLRLGKVQAPQIIGPTDTLYSSEQNKVLHNAAQENIKFFHKQHKQVNKDATMLESMIMQKQLTNNEDMIKWVIAGDSLFAVDNTKVYSDADIKAGKGWEKLNAKNKGKAEITVAKDKLGGTLGWQITNPNVEDAIERINPETGEKEWHYPSEFIKLDELLLAKLRSKYGDEPPPPSEAKNYIMGIYDNVVKGLKREMGLDVDADDELSTYVLQTIMEEFYRTGGAPGAGHPSNPNATTTTVSPEVQQYYQ